MGGMKVSPLTFAEITVWDLGSKPPHCIQGELQAYLHYLLLNLLQLCAFASLPTNLLVAGVLLPEGVQELHDLGLSQQLIVHGRPGDPSVGSIEPTLLQLRQQLVTFRNTQKVVVNLDSKEKPTKISSKTACF